MTSQGSRGWCPTRSNSSAPIEHTGVGDHDVEAAELLDRVGHHPLLPCEVADVDLLGADLAALALDEDHRLGEVRRLAGG